MQNAKVKIITKCFILYVFKNLFFYFNNTSDIISVISTDISGNINSNVYTSSNLLSSTTTLYGNRTLDFYKSDLISAGYVNLADIDSQIFNIKDVTKEHLVASLVDDKCATTSNDLLPSPSKLFV